MTLDLEIYMLEYALEKLRRARGVGEEVTYGERRQNLKAEFLREFTNIVRKRFGKIYLVTL